MDHINLVMERYSEPKKVLAVHHSDGLYSPILIAPDLLDEYFDLGNEIEVTAQQLREGSQIPLEWKRAEMCTDEWILGRVTAYDTITPRKPL